MKRLGLTERICQKKQKSVEIIAGLIIIGGE